MHKTKPKQPPVELHACNYCYRQFTRREGDEKEYCSSKCEKAAASYRNFAHSVVNSKQVK